MLTEAVNGDCSLSVVLDDLVVGGLGTSTLYHGVTVTLEGKSILANVDPPDVLRLSQLGVRGQEMDRLTSMVQDPSQWIPSIWSLPMMTFLRVPPFLTMKTVSLLPPST